MDESLIRLAIAVNWRNLALGHETFQAARATCVRNDTLPDIFDANFLFDVTAADPESVTRLLADASLEFAHASEITIRTGPFTPPAVGAWLSVHGWTRREAVVLLLAGAVTRAAVPCDIRPVVTEADWRAYAALKQLDLAGALSEERPGQRASLAEGMVTAARLKSPKVEYVLAYTSDEAIGYCSAWRGIEGVGQVEDLFVHPAHRRRGTATALLNHCVDRARQLGAGPIVLVVDPANSARRMYLALGWEPVAECRQFNRPTSEVGVA